MFPYFLTSLFVFILFGKGGNNNLTNIQPKMNVTVPIDVMLHSPMFIEMLTLERIENVLSSTFHLLKFYFILTMYLHDT